MVVVPFEVQFNPGSPPFEEMPEEREPREVVIISIITIAKKNWPIKKIGQ